MIKTLTPEAAASYVKTNRSAIMRAIYSNDLKALRSNSNRWQIAVSDLEAWAADHLITDRSVIKQDKISDDQKMISIDLAVAKAEIEGLKARLSDTQAERDRLADLLAKTLEARPVTRRRFWLF